MLNPSSALERIQQMIDQKLEKLENYETARHKLKLPQNFKPCILKMLITGLKKGQNSFQRSKVALVISVEFKRLNREKIEQVLNCWNKKNTPPLNPSEITGAIKQAQKEKYDFGCNSDVLSSFCGFSEDRNECWFYKQLMVNLGRKSKARHRESDFYKYGWQRILTLSQSMVYLGIRQIEKIQHKRPGQTIVAPYRLIVKYSGAYMGLINKSLRKLKEVGLILCEIGEPYRWKLKATEITRVIPIPRPNKKLEERPL